MLSKSRLVSAIKSVTRWVAITYFAPLALYLIFVLMASLGNLAFSITTGCMPPIPSRMPKFLRTPPVYSQVDWFIKQARDDYDRRFRKGCEEWLEAG